MSNRAPHLSKGPSDLEQNGTQRKTPVSSLVFHGLSCGVVRFVPTVSFWNHQIDASQWLMEEFLPELRGKRFRKHRKWCHTYTNYDVIFTPPMTSHRFQKRFLPNSESNTCQNTGNILLRLHLTCGKQCVQRNVVVVKVSCTLSTK